MFEYFKEIAFEKGQSFVDNKINVYLFDLAHAIFPCDVIFAISNVHLRELLKMFVLL